MSGSPWLICLVISSSGEQGWIYKLRPMWFLITLPDSRAFEMTPMIQVGTPGPLKWPPSSRLSAQLWGGRQVRRESGDAGIWAHAVLQESQPLILALSCQWHEPQGPQRKHKPATQSHIADKAPSPIIWSKLILGFMGFFLSPIG